ncbi:hypothetical protein [Sunxiuqinia sp. sy24]|uniref:hypothetical protein n=1 Tax=Sunxiuqinia sp. sy24 TaxID=3461495 RepID=UPI0040464B8D
MKTIRKLFIAMVAVVFGFTACNKTDEPTDNSIEGTYVGTLTADGVKSASAESTGSGNARAEVTKINDEQIEVHCYSVDFDTTFMLNYFEDHDSVMVCLTGDDFEHRYGHSIGQGHMMGGMMGDMHEGETEWEHHMSDEHQEGDEHFGGFDMPNHSFSYRFEITEQNSTHFLNFHGAKE